MKQFSVTNSDQKISVEDAYLDFRLEECSVPRGDPTSTLIFKISFSSNCKLLAIGKRRVHCLYDRSCDSNRTSRQAGKKVRDRKKTRISDFIMRKVRPSYLQSISSYSPNVSFRLLFNLYFGIWNIQLSSVNHFVFQSNIWMSMFPLLLCSLILSWETS